MKLRLLLSLLLFSMLAKAESSFGIYKGYSRVEGSIFIKAESSSLRVTFYKPDIIRVDFLPSPKTQPDSSFVVIRDAGDAEFVSISDADSSLRISSRSLTFVCQKFPVRLSFFDSSGALLLAEPPFGGLEAHQSERKVKFLLRPDEHFYGTGERGTGLDKRGQMFESYNTQNGGYSSPLSTMNLNVPFIASTGGYALYFDNTFKGRFDVGASDSTILSYTASGGELSYYFIAGRTIPQQLEKYTWLTGRQPLPPRWAFGFIQSKNHYQNETEARGIVDTLRGKKIPSDALVLDLHWFDKMGDLQWNRTSWPHPEKMVADFLARGIKTILITEPYIVDSSINFHDAISNGYVAKDSAGHPYFLTQWWSCGGCDATLLDMTNPAAREWWWSKYPSFLGTQVAGLWTDLGEPERHPADMNHFLGGTAKVHNIYDLLWAKTIFEGFAQYRPGDRVFNLTRSGFAGIQRYGAIPWSGDVARNFGGLAVQLPMLLNMGMSGLAYHNSDIGGYSRIPTTPELYIRWMEYGTFCPITRAHGAGEIVKGSPTEPWRFGPVAEKICRSYIELRYQLLPYIYTMAYENYKTGMPLARPLFWTDVDHHNLFNESSSYFWGDSFLVSPVVRAGQTTKEVFLPEGTWFNFWTDEIFQGGKTFNVPAPLKYMPIFIKSGSIIPFAPVMNYSDERPLDTLTLRVYPVETGRSSYTLYEDDGKTTSYQKGQCAATTFTQSLASIQNKSTLSLTIGPSTGSFNGKIQHRIYIVEVHGILKQPTIVRVNGISRTESSMSADGRVNEHKFCFNVEKSILTLPVSCNTDSSYTLYFDYTNPAH